MNKLWKVVKGLFCLSLFGLITYAYIYPKVDYSLNSKAYDSDNNISLDASLSKQQMEFTKDVAKLIEYATDMGYELTFGEVYRTMYQQRHNVATGVSWTYNSKHLKRLAVDFNLFIDGRYISDCESYRPLGEYWESLNSRNQWGGSWHSVKDCPHFQRRP